MRDVLVIVAVVVFFVAGAAYLMVSARILARSGDIAEELADDPAEEPAGDSDDATADRAARAEASRVAP